MATMLDVSVKAGVSMSTVSRVLNGTAKISEATKKLVYQAVDELGYRPNAIAQSLAKDETNTIGLVIPRGSNISRYLGIVIEMCQELADQLGKYLIITQVNDQDNGAAKAISSLVDRRCDAILYYNNSFFDHQSGQETQINSLIEKLKIPLIVLNYHSPDYPNNCVWFDHRQSARIPVDYLLSKGHKKIAYISGPLHQRTAQLRLEGYQKALESAGIAFQPLLLAEGDRLFSGGYSACNQLLQRKVEFTAICCFNDQTAIGALKALGEKRIAVPDTISLVGFDNDDVTSYQNPSICTVSLPIHTFVQTAFDSLIANLNKTDLPNIEQNGFVGELILGGSVKDLTQ
jgi:LacI family asc operon transcriptional repressor